MAYKCTQCEYVAEEAGECPTCKAPLAEEPKEEVTEPKEA